eukprot:scaffold16657_cov41-Attheya_sp.AAC.1
MGIKDLLPNLPGGDITLKGFASISSLKDKVVPVDVDFDTGSLVYVCALRNRTTFESGDYLPAVREFQKQLMGPMFLYKWALLLVFDGEPPEEKRFEHDRRKKKSDGIVITSVYIFCKHYQIPYVVSAQEADMQVGRQRKGAVIVTNDGDLVAYGNKK